jgi:uncharacterized membrane protein YdbT with pleckstrin-like domain
VSLPKKHLYNDEEVVIDMHPHWWYLVPRGSLLLLSMVLAVWFFAAKPGKRDSGGYEWYGEGLRWAAIILLVASLVIFLARLIQWNFINFVVTTERCIYRSGVFAKTGIEIPLDRINTVFFNQTVFERLVRAGDLAIESAGENSRQQFSDIYNPLNVQNEIYRQMEAYEDRKTDKLRGAIHHGATGGAASSAADEIAKLHQLRQSGAITDEEYEIQKSRLLNP